MKKGVLGIVFLVLVLFIFGCNLQPQRGLKQQAPVKEFLDCEKPKTSAEIKACSMIASNPKLQQCKDREINEVFFCIAILTKDSEVCENLKDAYYLCRAYTDDNPSMCDNMESQTGIDMCYADLGINLRSAELCNKVKSAAKRSSCLGAVNLDIDRCFDSNMTKRICVENVVEFSQGKVSCSKLTGEKLKECLNIIGG